MKILVVNFSYNQKLKNKETFIKHVKNRKSTEIMENEKFYCERKNCYFKNVSNI